MVQSTLSTWSCRTDKYLWCGKLRVLIFVLSCLLLLLLLLIAGWVYSVNMPKFLTGNKDNEDNKENENSKENMINNDLADMYHNFMETIRFYCKNIYRAGNSGDGGWNVCMDSKYIPKTPCLIYSFGIGWDSSFDIEAYKKFNCEVHSFDPTLQDDQINMINPLIHFHPVGLSDQNNVIDNLEYQTLYEIRRTLGHLNTKLDVLKIDIEEWEWRSLRFAILNKTLDDVQQLLIEFHLIELSRNNYWNDYRPHIKILLELESLGFRAFSVQRNEACNYLNKDNRLLTFCHNMHFVKVN